MVSEIWRAVSDLIINTLHAMRFLLLRGGCHAGPAE